MKKLLVIAMLCISNIAQAQLTSKQEVAPQLVEKREAEKKEIVKNYLTLKNSFIVSDSLEVVKNATALQNSLNRFKFKKLKLEQMNEAMQARKEIIALAADIAATTNINKQREVFNILSSKFWGQAAKFKVTDVILNLQVCPMTGAMWISDTKEIKNPYYPKNMLTCGQVKASL